MWHLANGKWKNKTKQIEKICKGQEKSKVLISLPPLLKVENNKHERLIEKKNSSNGGT
jgi:hypothetical protein